jgi:CysZ protein
MNEFKRGFSYFLSGFTLIFKPKIRFYTIIPLLINITLFTIVIFYAFDILEHFIAVFQTQWRWIEWLRWLIRIVFFIGISIVVFFCFSIFANIISAPFNVLLAKAVEEKLTGVQLQSNNKKLSLNLIIVSMRSEFRKLVYFSIRIPILLLLPNN